MELGDIVWRVGELAVQRKARRQARLTYPGFGGGSAHWIPTEWLVSVW